MGGVSLIWQGHMASLKTNPAGVIQKHGDIFFCEPLLLPELYALKLEFGFRDAFARHYIYTS